jgi:hypothetical protein
LVAPPRPLDLTLVRHPGATPVAGLNQKDYAPDMTGRVRRSGGTRQRIGVGDLTTLGGVAIVPKWALYSAVCAARAEGSAW